VSSIKTWIAQLSVADHFQLGADRRLPVQISWVLGMPHFVMVHRSDSGTRLAAENM
jgi:hypothetical protein